MRYPAFRLVRLEAHSDGPIVQPDALAGALELREQLRRDAAARLRRARRALAMRRVRAHAWARQQYDQLMAEGAQSQVLAERAAIADAVQWLADEHALERLVAERVAERVARCATDAFVEFSRSVDRAGLLGERVRELITRSFRDAQLELQMHPTDANALGPIDLPGVASVVQDEALSPGAAVIETPFVRVVIDVERHATLLASHLQSLSEDDTPSLTSQPIRDDVERGNGSADSGQHRAGAA